MNNIYKNFLNSIEEFDKIIYSLLKVEHKDLLKLCIALKAIEYELEEFELFLLNIYDYPYLKNNFRITGINTVNLLTKGNTEIFIFFKAGRYDITYTFFQENNIESFKVTYKNTTKYFSETTEMLDYLGYKHNFIDYRTFYLDLINLFNDYIKNKFNVPCFLKLSKVEFWEYIFNPNYSKIYTAVRKFILNNYILIFPSEYPEIKFRYAITEEDTVLKMMFMEVEEPKNWEDSGYTLYYSNNTTKKKYDIAMRLSNIELSDIEESLKAFNAMIIAYEKQKQKA